jgi:hypothetical protein
MRTGAPSAGFFMPARVQKPDFLKRFLEIIKPEARSCFLVSGHADGHERSSVAALPWVIVCPRV